MNDVPLVSSIIIFLNAERFIPAAIDSIVAQTYSNWEILLVDDGSTDNSASIADRYVRMYPDRIRYLQHPEHQNRGMSASRNLGIDNARGEYIALLDADDVWLPDKLAEQVAIFSAHPTAAMVYGQALRWYSWSEGEGESPLADYFTPLGTAPNRLIQPPELVLPFLQDLIQPPTTSSMLVRREVFNTIGRFEDDFRGLAEDKVFILKVLLSAPIFVSDSCWTKYRKYDDTKCADRRENNRVLFEGYRVYFDWVKKYLAEQGMVDRHIWQALNQERIRYCHPILYYLSDPQELAVWIGRRILLPKHIRHWLWMTFSSKASSQVRS
jgi:glycosyltransferase involved in cell wall biosynthesis